MMGVRRNVQIHPTRRLVQLGDFMHVHGLRGDVDVLEEVGRGELARVGHAVRGRVVVLQQLGFERGRELVEGGARVGEVGVAAVARRGQLVGAEERVGGAPRVEGAVDVEEGVSLTLWSTWEVCFEGKEGPFGIGLWANWGQ